MADSIDFTKKYGSRALIAGASAGLGACFAEECAKRQMNVAIVARRLGKLNEVAGSLKDKYGVETKVIVSDISDADCAKHIYEAVSDLDVGFYI
ncbi:MAG: SDR family NAD(P)-dependent oxidoreductase [Eubacteriaceae bacterium]|nr:SDR family NAD(P)-dependent oxidoreductase [Eubacteriaceae bacterium]